jgi:DNA polymerase elongation subunit (family B)
MVLINLSLEGGFMRRIYNGGRCELDCYSPHFYVICNNPDEVRHLIEQHPFVLEAVRKKDAVKVVTQIKHYKKVIRDMKKVPGIKELAETSVPHYFRYACEKDLKFFDGPEELLLGVMRPHDRIPKCDVLFTNGGDRFLQGKGVKITPIGRFLRECVHIDVQTDMQYDIYGETRCGDLLELGKERLIRIVELSRMTGIKPDIVSRITPGKLNSYLHMRAAKNNGMMIPDIKKPVEKPKSLRLLQIMDKGGTIFYPRPGIYHNVAKCDFASMYPNIIVKFNISPETMHCRCDDYIEVPEANWRICKRKGLIPQGIEAVLTRRLELKKLMNNSSGEQRKIYDIKQRALKNILVTCFGYLGFSNFVFSNVETKECVMLFGRHILERTKLIAEEEGLEVIYGIVDSVFVRGGTKEQYQNYVKRVSEEFGIELELDCIFEHLAFPAGREGEGIANKYYGITYEGEIEARGIGLRHSDAPPFIKQFQKEAIQSLFSSNQMDDVYLRYQNAIIGRGFPLEDFAITKAMRKERYKVNAAHVVAYNKHPVGTAVTYVYAHYGPVPVSMSSKAELDCAEYLRLLKRYRKELINVIYPIKS